MKFDINECWLSDGNKIEGLYEILPRKFTDERGWFLEYYNERDFFSAGLKMKFVQDNHSRSEKGVLRGLHFQTNHTQGKLIRISYGKVYDIVVDLRNESKTFGNYFGIILDSEKQNMLYVPKGFAHGFLVISDFAESVYKCTDYYSPEYESGIKWNDESISVNWNEYIAPEKIILSEKDKNNPAFDKSKKYFDNQGNWIGLH